jgi:hypothetical protein
MTQQRSLITIKGLDELKKGLSDLQLEQYPYAMKNAINRTADKAKTAVVARMDIDFDRPTAFTKNSMRVEYATKSKLSGAVRFKDPERLSDSQHYLYPNVYGVKRGFKKFEAALYAKRLLPSGWYAVPGKDQPLDAFGNVSSGLIKEILAWFEANPINAGYQSNMTAATRAKRKRGTKKTFGYEFFALNKPSGRLLPGIYRRVFLGDEIKIYSVFIFVPASHVWYTRSYKFHETGRDIFNTAFKTTFADELQNAMETAFK